MNRVEENEGVDGARSGQEWKKLGRKPVARGVPPVPVGMRVKMIRKMSP